MPVVWLTGAPVVDSTTSVVDWLSTSVVDWLSAALVVVSPPGRTFGVVKSAVVEAPSAEVASDVAEETSAEVASEVAGETSAEVASEVAEEMSAEETSDDVVETESAYEGRVSVCAAVVVVSPPGRTLGVVKPRVVDDFLLWW